MEGIANSWMWAGFALFVIVAITVDLVALDKKGSHAVGVKEALGWSALWVALALIFNAGLWFWLDATAGREMANLKATEFLTGYLIEKSLSVDNIFVFLMILSAFAVPAELQKRALIIGVIGAVVLRAIMILIGAWLIAQFHWILYVFGAFLLLTGIKMIWAADHEPDLEEPGPEMDARPPEDHEGVRRREADADAGRCPLVHAAVRRRRADRHHRRDLRDELHPRDLRHHHRPVHRHDLEHLRHPRPQGAVLPAR